MKRRVKRKEIAVRVPVHAEARRTEEYDAMALAAANALSSTPVKKFKFLGKTLSGLLVDTEYLVYTAYGTPREDQ